jgi:hypothetical protein
VLELRFRTWRGCLTLGKRVFKNLSIGLPPEETYPSLEVELIWLLYLQRVTYTEQEIYRIIQTGFPSGRNRLIYVLPFTRAMRNKEVQDFVQSGGGKAALFAILGPSIVRIKQNRASISYSGIIAVYDSKVALGTGE